jgi:Na+/phosphate symporter
MTVVALPIARRATRVSLPLVGAFMVGAIAYGGLYTFPAISIAFADEFGISRTLAVTPWTMFLLGCLVATLTLSVSVALTVLVPLAVKGYVKRDEALPYIMGANITTLADTLVVAMLQDDPDAARIVLAEAIGVTIVSLVILAFLYRPVKRSVLSLEDALVTDNRKLAYFVATLFIVPIALIASGLFFTVA